MQEGKYTSIIPKVHNLFAHNWHILDMPAKGKCRVLLQALKEVPVLFCIMTLSDPETQFQDEACISKCTRALLIFVLKGSGKELDFKIQNPSC